MTVRIPKGVLIGVTALLLIGGGVAAGAPDRKRGRHH